MNERSSSRGHTAHGPTRDGQQSRDASDGRAAPASTSRRKFLGQAAAVTATAAIIGVPSLSELREATAAAQATDCPANCELGPLMGVNRADTAHKRRVSAADYERNMPIPAHPCNGDEQAYAGQNFFASFTKALPHPNQFGEVDPAAYCALLRALASGKPADFEAVPLGCNPICAVPLDTSTISDDESRLAPPDPTRTKQRRLQNPQAGYNFDLEGKDYQQLINRDTPLPPPVPIAFPAAIPFASPSEVVEIIENYWQALTRDVPFINYNSDLLVQAAAADLNKPQIKQYYGGPLDPWGNVTPAVYSRGNLPGDTAGPFLSQLLLRDVPYGVQTIGARVKVPLPDSSTVSNDFMTKFDEWLTVQNGCTPSRATAFDSVRRYIRSGRDLAEYVHNDAIYQAYLNAALLLMTPPKMGGLGARLDSNNPYVSYCKQDNFVEFGPSQLLSLIGEVSVRAHKAIWYQKWQVHRRLRPEEFGARVHFWETNPIAHQRYPINELINQSDAPGKTYSRFGSYFLPQAFPEGSPIHPSYGAGHATLAGACVTILKAWFDEAQPFCDLAKPVVPSADGTSLITLDCSDSNIGQLTVGGELNKLASNIAIARNIAGVHWRSDYTESVFLGEKVAIQLLEDYGFTYNEDFAGFHLTDFNGNQRLVGAKRTS